MVSAMGSQEAGFKEASQLGGIEPCLLYSRGWGGYLQPPGSSATHLSTTKCPFPRRRPPSRPSSHLVKSSTRR